MEWELSHGKHANNGMIIRLILAVFVEETLMQWKMCLGFRISYQGLKGRRRCDLHLIHIQTFI